MRIFVGVRIFFFAVEAFDMGDVFFFFFNTIDICYRRIIVATPVPAFYNPKNLFGGLGTFC